MNPPMSWLQNEKPLKPNERPPRRVAAMAVSFFAFMGLLSVSELSFAVPATAITYVLETALSRYVLKERVNWLRWAGASLVICGVALISL